MAHAKARRREKAFGMDRHKLGEGASKSVRGNTMHKLVAFTVGLLTATGAANAAEIKVLSAKAARLILEELAPQFERVTNNKVTINYDEAGIVRQRILRGETFDVTFLPAGWDEVRPKIAGAPIAIGHTDLRMAVLATMPKPDTSSNDAAKRTLLAAKSIVYTDPKTGIAGILFARMIERLGIADEINKKSKLVAGVLNATFVVKGEADLAVQLSSEILAVPGVQFVPMPPDFRARPSHCYAHNSVHPAPTSVKLPLQVAAMRVFFGHCPRDQVPDFKVLNVCCASMSPYPNC
jgi:molybdate transport system substrate-binding protein